jgi:hypothetical protein
MYPRSLLAIVCVSVVAVFAWFTSADPKTAALKSWEKIAEGIYCTKSSPHEYALIDRDKALLIDASVAPDVVDEWGVKIVEGEGRFSTA